MTALSTVVDRTLQLVDRHRGARNKLNATINTSVDSLVTTYDLGSIQAGGRISIDLEDFHVWVTDPSTKTVTVERGDGESVAAAHTAGAVIQVNPEVSRFDVVQAVNEEIAELSSPARGLYQMLAIDLTYSAAVQGYDLAAVASTFLEVYELRFKQTGSSKYWPNINDFDVSRSMATSEFASGSAIFLFAGGQSGQPIRVRYKAKFTQLGTTDETQVVETVTGLSESGVNILPYGAAARLAAGRPYRRAAMDAQGDSRRAEEVSTNDSIVSVSGLLRQRDLAVAAEAARLAKQYPMRGL